jgi:hypothetical protein
MLLHGGHQGFTYLLPAPIFFWSIIPPESKMRESEKIVFTYLLNRDHFLGKRR